MQRSSLVRRSKPFPDATTGPWQIDLFFGRVGRRVECVGLDVHPLPGADAEPLTTTVLRRLNLGTLIGEVLEDGDVDLQRLVGIRRRFGASLGEMRDAGIGPLARHRKRPGPKPKNRAHYVEVARVYLAAPAKPTKAVADHFTVNASTAAKYVSGARLRGLIPPTTRGKRS